MIERWVPLVPFKAKVEVPLLMAGVMIYSPPVFLTYNVIKMEVSFKNIFFSKPFLIFLRQFKLCKYLLAIFYRQCVKL